MFKRLAALIRALASRNKAMRLIVVMAGDAKKDLNQTESDARLCPTEEKKLKITLRFLAY